MKRVNLPIGESASVELVPPRYTAFAGHRCIASGLLTQVARKTRRVAERGEEEPILVFDDTTGEAIELDLRGTEGEVIERLTRACKPNVACAVGAEKRSRGRPMLGVISREVTLLPGQWDWLDEQPGGASGALRRLVYEARRSDDGQSRARQSQEAVYRFMTTMAGNLAGFEEALRAFYRWDYERFENLVARWPRDIGRHVKKLVAAAERQRTG